MRRTTSKSSMVRHGFAVFAMIWLALGLTPASAQQAASNEVFVVRAVPVDETAGSTAIARNNALAAGKLVAAQQLVARLTRSADRANLAPLDADIARGLVASFQIDNEKTSDVRYLADLTVTFKPEAVRALLRASGVPFAEARSRPVLVVPVLQGAGVYVLWETPNPWREAWQNHPPSEGLVPVVVPVGDLSDITGLTAEQAIEADAGALGDATARYGAGSAMVAIASLDAATPGGESVDITATRAGRLDEPPLLLSLQNQTGEPLDLFLDRAVGDVIEALNDEWKNTNIFTPGQSGRLHAAVPVPDLKSWIEVQRRLARAPNVSAVHVLALTANSAEIEIDYLGDTERLARALDRIDLLLEDSGFSGPDPASGGAGAGAAGPPLPTHVLRLAGS
jgi:hypothetical protein